MAWVQFNSVNDFNTWHDLIKKELGLPKVSVDAEGNEIEGSVIVTDYTKPIVVSPTDVRALIADELADGLTLSEPPIVSNYEANSL